MIKSDSIVEDLLEQVKINHKDDYKNSHAYLLGYLISFIECNMNPALHKKIVERIEYMKSC